MKKKRTLSAVLAVAMTASLCCAPAYAAPSTKTNTLDGKTISGWADSQVRSAYDLGIVPTSELPADYTKPITRSQFCAIAAAVYETKTGETPTYGENPFTDVEASDVNVRKMAAKGIISGYGDGKFGPADPITREQAAVLITKLASAMGEELTAAKTPFADNFSSWAEDSVGKVYGAGIMSGYGGSVFGAKDSYTIEQSIISLQKTFECVEDKTSTEEKVEEPAKNVYTRVLDSEHKLTIGFNKKGQLEATVRRIDTSMLPEPDYVYAVNEDGTVTEYLARDGEALFYTAYTVYDAVILKDENGNILFNSETYRSPTDFDVSLDQTNITVTAKGDPVLLTVSCTLDESEYTVKWSSSNSEVANSWSGRVYGYKSGTAEITAIVTAGTVTKTATCHVTVTDDSVEKPTDPPKPIEPENPDEPEVPDIDLPGLILNSGMDWSGANQFGANDWSVSKPKTGYAMGHYIVDNGDGTFSGLVVRPVQQKYDYATGEWVTIDPESIGVEVYNAQGQVVETKTLSMELPIFGSFLSGAEYNYIAFGQTNKAMNDSQEVWRVVQYDKAWNRLGSVSANGGETYTTEPFRSTVARMAESADGQKVVLYAARTRYDGHQSNITFVMNAEPFSIKTVMGEKFPSNHVSHSFGQFVQFDGDTFVTVDHGDAYPRAFVLQKGGREETLLAIAGSTGNNVTNAIGSGFEVSDSGYLFLGCSDPQTGSGGEPWNVFLTYTDKNLNSTTFTWLTNSAQTIDCARLVKLTGSSFLAMWQETDGIHYQRLDAQGNTVGSEEVLKDAPMPPTQPMVSNGTVYWIGVTSGSTPRVALYTIPVN